ncbi:MAG: polyamine aminopropyltransferase [Syntrophales bacterium]
MAPGLPRIRRHLSLALISAAVIAFQLALMQFLSLVQWHHFAAMIIAVALLGFGAAGTCLALLRPRLMGRFAFLLPLLMCLSAAAMALAVRIAQGPRVRFDSLLVFTGTGEFLKLFLTYGVFFLPIFLAALAVGMLFVRDAREIGRLYFWNLAGSAAGGALMTGLMWLFAPPVLPGLAALSALIAALLVLPEGLAGTAAAEELPQAGGDSGGSAAGRQLRRDAGRPARGRRLALVAAASLSALAVAFSVARPPVPLLSEFKGLSRALHLPGGRITAEQTSPHGLMQRFSSPALRAAPGLSLTWQEEIPAGAALFNSGDWFGAIVGPGQGAFLDHTTGALPYALGEPKSVLILDAGSLGLVSQAVNRGATRITAVEPHPAVLPLLAGESPGGGGAAFRHPTVSVHTLSSRAFLSRDRALYDLVLLPTPDAFGGTSGLYAVREDYLLTREALGQVWRKLTPGGAISVTCWVDEPLRHPLKALALLVEALEAEGVVDVRSHLAAVRGWATITLLAKKSPLTAADGDNIRRFCAGLQFDPALLPGLRPDQRMRFHALPDDRLFLALDELLGPSRGRFIAAYPFAIAPATDDRPYFSQFLRWQSIPHLAARYGLAAFPFLEAGYLLILLTLGQVAAAAVVLILVPLRVLGPARRSRLATLLYFGGLGLGYLFVEIVLIQRFILTLGNPITAAAVVIAGMLLSSGVGSLLAERLLRNRWRGPALLGMICLTILLYARFLTPLLLATIALPEAARLALAVLLIAPAGLLMGMPFPLGIRVLAATAEAEIPWAWGINGCLSVVGTLLATVIAVELGFTWVMAAAAAAYGLALLALFRLDNRTKVLYNAPP